MDVIKCVVAVNLPSTVQLVEKVTAVIFEKKVDQCSMTGSYSMAKMFTFLPLWVLSPPADLLNSLDTEFNCGQVLFPKPGRFAALS